MNYNDPYLEYYESEEAMLENTPINILFLASCMNVVRERVRTGQQEAAFTIVLKERYLTLIAATRLGLDCFFFYHSLFNKMYLEKKLNLLE